MSPLELNELLQELKAETAEINLAWVVINDSKLVKDLAEKISEDNLFLVGVLPAYGTTGISVDAYRDTAISQLLILKKTGYGELTYDDMLLMFEETYQVAKKIKAYILGKATADCHPFLLNLNVNSLDIDPVYEVAECNGYSIDLEIK